MTTLRRIQDIRGWELEARDGTIGFCGDFLFGDNDWVVRYMVANTRKWLPGRKVLISPIAVTDFDERNNRLVLDLTKNQIKEAPPLDSNAPVSRRYEEMFNRYFAWQNYWSGNAAWGLHQAPRLLHQPGEAILRNPQHLPEYSRLVPEEETHLRSAGEVIGYHIHATDEKIGHIEDFILNPESWTLAYLIIDTRNWLPGGKWVVIVPGWIESIDWGTKEAVTSVSAFTIRNAPAFKHNNQIDRDYEKILIDYYGSPPPHEPP